MSRLRAAVFATTAGAVTYGLALVFMDVLLARMYGLGGQAAVFQAAYQVPAMLLAVLSGGAVIGPLVPVISRLRRQTDEATTNYELARVTGFVTGVHGIVIVILLAFAGLLALLLGSGFPPGLQADLTVAIRWGLVLLVVHGLASVGISALLSCGHVGVASLVPALMPVAGMATFPWWGADGALLILYGYIAGTVVQVAVTAAVLRRDGLVFLPPAVPRGAVVATFANTFIATGLAHAALSAVLLVNMAVAGGMSERELAAFSYGTRLVMLALAFLTTLVNNVGLPHLSELAHGKGRDEYRDALVRMLRIAVAGSSAFALVWIVSADEVVRFVYVRDSFTAADAAAVATIQRAFVLQAPFYVMGVICWRALNVSGKAWPLVLASMAALAVDVPLAMWASVRWGSSGIAGAHTIATAVWGLLLLAAVQHQYRNGNIRGAR